jgi:hypothetical protein
LDDRAGLWRELVPLGVTSFAPSSVGIIAWFDNAQGYLTGNGVFKTVELRPWIADPATHRSIPSNYLFYPAYGALCRLLDGLGILVGDPRRQLTILNAASASFCLCIIYALARVLSRDRMLAAITALFHLACSFVLMLAITNEDIMPSYTVTLAAMALGARWFTSPTPWRVLAVSALFSVGWLFEWRLMFPALPGFLVALWLGESTVAARLRSLALFLAGMLATATLVAWLWRGHNGAVGPLD